jgi:hypothetical protein
LKDKYWGNKEMGKYEITESQKARDAAFAKRNQDQDERLKTRASVKKFIENYAFKDDILALVEEYNAREGVEKIVAK